MKKIKIKYVGCDIGYVSINFKLFPFNKKSSEQKLFTSHAKSMDVVSYILNVDVLLI